MNTTPQLPTPPVIISDCLPGFRHPPGDLATCIQDAVPPAEVPTAQPIPSLGTGALIGLVLMIFVAAWTRTRSRS